MRSRLQPITPGKTEEIYRKLLDSIDAYDDPHVFIDLLYNNYLEQYDSSPSINGKIFEYTICETLVRENIIPFYYQARFTNVPNCDFDIVLYDPKMPIVLSIKTSLRERYKQADLEGIALKQVYRRSKQYLITMNKDEAKSIKKKINDCEINGIDNVYVATNQEYSILLSEIQLKKFQQATPILPIWGKSCINFSPE